MCLNGGLPCALIVADTPNAHKPLTAIMSLDGVLLVFPLWLQLCPIHTWQQVYSHIQADHEVACR